MFLTDANNLAMVSSGAVVRVVLEEHSEPKFFADATQNTYVLADMSMVVRMHVCMQKLYACLYGLCLYACVHVCRYYCIPNQFEFLQS